MNKLLAENKQAIDFQADGQENKEVSLEQKRLNRKQVHTKFDIERQTKAQQNQVWNVFFQNRKQSWKWPWGLEERASEA